MEVPIVKIGKTKKDIMLQLEKIIEEVKELKVELKSKSYCLVLHEAVDVIFATMTLMNAIAYKNDIEKSFQNTIEKLERRQKQGKIKIEKHIKI